MSMLPPLLRPTRESPRINREATVCRLCPELPLRTQCPHSDTGRLYLSQLATTDKASRAPQRCTKCPNRPFRSQCQHTKAGKIFLRDQAIQAEVAQSLSLALPLNRPMESIPSAPGEAPTLPIQTSVPSSPGTLTVSSLRVPFDEQNLDPVLRQQTAQVPLSLDITHIPEPIPRDPTPEIPGCVNHSTMTPSNPRHPTPESLRGVFTAPMTPSSSLQSGSSSSLDTPTRPSQKHSRATKGNPYHGFVKGTMRGAQRHEIFRRHKRPDPLLDSKDASKTFLDKMNRLLERAEDLSVKTGCWLFVGAQHPAGVGATIHYTSPRLLRDAPDDMDTLVNNYHQLMSSLLQARRAEALDLAKKYQVSVSENHTMAARVADLEAQMTTMKHAIDVYEAQLFHRTQPDPQSPSFPIG